MFQENGTTVVQENSCWKEETVLLISIYLFYCYCKSKTQRLRSFDPPCMCAQHGTRSIQCLNGGWSWSEVSAHLKFIDCFLFAHSDSLKWAFIWFFGSPLEPMHKLQSDTASVWVNTKKKTRHAHANTGCFCLTKQTLHSKDCILTSATFVWKVKHKVGPEKWIPEG